jgi:N-acetylglutamate synthase/N-acetylornithine aminotransferase
VAPGAVLVDVAAQAIVQVIVNLALDPIVDAVSQVVSEPVVQMIVKRAEGPMMLVEARVQRAQSVADARLHARARARPPRLGAGPIGAPAHQGTPDTFTRSTAST